MAQDRGSVPPVGSRDHHHDDEEDDYPEGPISWCLQLLSRRVGSGLCGDTSWTIALVLTWAVSGVSLLLFAMALALGGWATVHTADGPSTGPYGGSRQDYGLWQVCLTDGTDGGDSVCEDITEETNPGPAFRASQAFSVLSLVSLVAGAVLLMCHTAKPSSSTRLAAAALWNKLVAAVLLMMLVIVFSSSWYKPKYVGSEYTRTLNYCFKMAAACLAFEMVGAFFLYMEIRAQRATTNHDRRLLKESNIVDDDADSDQSRRFKNRYGHLNGAMTGVHNGGAAFPADDIDTSPYHYTQNQETSLEQQVYSTFNARSAFVAFSNSAKNTYNRTPSRSRAASVVSEQSLSFRSEEAVAQRFMGITLSEPAYISQQQQEQQQQQQQFKQHKQQHQQKQQQTQHPQHVDIVVVSEDGGQVPPKQRQTYSHAGSTTHSMTHIQHMSHQGSKAPHSHHTTNHRPGGSSERNDYHHHGATRTGSTHAPISSQQQYKDIHRGQGESPQTFNIPMDRQGRMITSVSMYDLSSDPDSNHDARSPGRSQDQRSVISRRSLHEANHTRGNIANRDIQKSMTAESRTRSYTDVGQGVQTMNTDTHQKRDRPIRDTSESQSGYTHKSIQRTHQDHQQDIKGSTDLHQSRSSVRDGKSRDTDSQFSSWGDVVQITAQHAQPRAPARRKRDQMRAAAAQYGQTSQPHRSASSDRKRTENMGGDRSRSGRMSDNRARSSSIGGDRARSRSIGDDRSRSGSIGNDRARSGSMGGDRARSGSLGDDRARSGSTGGDRARSGSRSIGDDRSKSGPVDEARSRSGSMGGDRARSGNTGGDRARNASVGGDRARSGSIAGDRDRMGNINGEIAGRHPNHGDRARDRNTTRTAVDPNLTTPQNSATSQSLRRAQSSTSLYSTVSLATTIVGGCAESEI